MTSPKCTSLFDPEASMSSLRKELQEGYFLRLRKMAARRVHPVSSATKIIPGVCVSPPRLRRYAKTAPTGQITRRRRTRRTRTAWHPCTSPPECKSKSEPLVIKNTYFDRAALSRREYIDVLSTPHLHSGKVDSGKFRSKSVPKVCHKRRWNLLALPTPQRLLTTLQEHVRHLAPEIILRVRKMLKSAIDYRKTINDARYSFKCHDEKEQRERVRKLRVEKKRRNTWFDVQIEKTAEAIARYFMEKRDTPLLSYRQELIYESLVQRMFAMVQKGGLGKKCRCDIFMDENFALILHFVTSWITKAMNMADVRTAMDLGMWDKKKPGGDAGAEEGGGEGADEGDEWQGKLETMGSLEKLIWILAQGSSDYLGAKVDDLENVTRNELLNKIKTLNKDYTPAESPAEILRRIIYEWAMHNRASQIDVMIVKKIEWVAQLLAAMLAAEDLYGMLSLGPAVEIATLSTHVTELGVAEEAEPLAGTVTEVLGPDGDVQMGVVDDLGGITPVQLTPSGNLIPTVYDRNGKIVNELYDIDGNLLEVTFNKCGVPEPTTYNDLLFDDVKYEHELIYNSKGRMIPLCYDKEGRPIGPECDPSIWYGPDGSLIQVPPGGFAKIVGGRLVIMDANGEEVVVEVDETESEVESALMEGGESEIELTEEEEEETVEETEQSEIAETETESSEIAQATPEEVGSTTSMDSMVRIIKGHKPRKVYEHNNGIACCLSMKIWTVWLLEVSHNSLSWGKWIGNIVGKVREYAAIMRGEVLLPNGQKKAMFANDWNKFVDNMNEDIVAWRQYDRHVKDLTDGIIHKFDGKQVRCCPQCCQDHLVKDVVSVHDTIRALTEAMNCAGYWRRCLDEIVNATSNFLDVPLELEGGSSDSETGWSFSSVHNRMFNDFLQCANRHKMKPLETFGQYQGISCICPCKLRRMLSNY